MLERKILVSEVRTKSIPSEFVPVSVVEDLDCIIDSSKRSIMYKNSQISPENWLTLIKNGYIGVTPAGALATDYAEDELIIEKETGDIKYSSGGEWVRLLNPSIIKNTDTTLVDPADYEVGDIIFDTTLQELIYVVDNFGNNSFQTIPLNSGGGGGGGDPTPPTLVINGITTGDVTAQPGELIIGDIASSDIIVTLPDASTCQNSQVGIKLKGIVTQFSITVTPFGTNTIDGEASYTLDTDYESVILISDGSDWWIIG